MFIGKSALACAAVFLALAAQTTALAIPKYEASMHLSLSHGSQLTIVRSAGLAIVGRNATSLNPVKAAAAASPAKSAPADPKKKKHHKGKGKKAKGKKAKGKVAASGSAAATEAEGMFPPFMLLLLSERHV